MRGVNKAILVGNLGKDPEVQYLDNGVCVTKFPLATTESYKDKSGNRIDQTEWHNIVLWRGLAEVAEKYLKKGSGVYLEGRIKTRSWDDKEGVKRYTTEIVGDSFIMLDKKNGDSSNSYSSEDMNTSETANEDESPNIEDNKEESVTSDDLPF